MCPSNVRNVVMLVKRFTKSVTFCMQSAVPHFCSKLRNYIAAAASWSVFCIAFCCSLYHIHSALCSCAAYGKYSSDCSVWVTKFLGTVVLTSAKRKYIIIIIIVIIIIIIITVPFHATLPWTKSLSFPTLKFSLYVCLPCTVYLTTPFVVSSSNRWTFSWQLISRSLNLNNTQNKIYLTTVTGTSFLQRVYNFLFLRKYSSFTI